MQERLPSESLGWWIDRSVIKPPQQRVAPQNLVILRVRAFLLLLWLGRFVEAPFLLGKNGVCVCGLAYAYRRNALAEDLLLLLVLSLFSCCRPTLPRHLGAVTVFVVAAGLDF